MSKKLEFIKYIENLIDATKDFPVEMSNEARIYWEAFKGKDEIDKPAFTDNGKLILKYLQENQSVGSWKAKDIAEGLFISSRTVSGSIRKLCTDNYVEKLSQDPVVYALTEKGKNIIIED